MITDNTFDLFEAHYLLESDFNVSGILQERPSNQRRKMSTSFQLSRMGFHPMPSLSFETLSDNGKQIYMDLVFQYGLESSLIRTVKDLDYFLPDAVLVDRDYDVLATLCSIGYLDSSLEEDPNWIDSEDWINCDYALLFVLLDESGADYSHVWGLSWGTIPHMDRPVDLIWKNYKLLV
jgi:hypothetical protein